MNIMNYPQIYQMIEEKIDGLSKRMDERFDKVECNFVSKQEFAPYRAALNTAGLLFLVSAIGAVIYIIATHPMALLAK